MTDARENYDRTGQTNKGPNIAAQATDLICKMYLGEIEKGNFKHNNYFNEIRTQLHIAKDTDRRTLRKLSANKESLDYFAEHTSGNTMIDKVLNSKITQLEQGYNSCKEHITMLELALKLIDECKYNGEEIHEEPLQMHGFHMSGFTTA